MKRFLFALSFCCFAAQSASSAAPADYSVDLEFESVPLGTFLQLTYRDILHADYAVDPSIVSTKTISIHARVPLSQVQQTVDDLLSGSGVGIRHAGSITQFVPSGLSENRADADLSEMPEIYDFRKTAKADPQSLSSALDPLPVAGSGQNFDHVEFYQPKFRRPADVQKIVNQFLHTNFEAQIDSVMLAGSDADMQKIHTILSAFDAPVSEVSIRGAIIEYTENNSESRGFGLAVDVLRSSLSASVGAISPAGNYLKIEKSSVSAVLSAISGDSRFSLVSAPSLRIRTGQKGHIQIGDSTPTLSSTTTNGSGAVTQSVDYRDSGVILDVTPTILGETVDLDISQQLSSFSQTDTSEINSPTLSKRELATLVSAKNDELIVLGGLDSSEKTDTNTGFSLLPSWLRTNTASGKKSQILLLLQVQRVIQ